MTKKGVPEIALKSGTPQDSNSSLLTSPEAPGDDASRAHFQQQKQQLGQQQQQLQQQLQKTATRVQFLFEVVVRILLFLDVAVPSHLEELFELLHRLHQKAHDLTRPGQRPGEFAIKSRNH